MFVVNFFAQGKINLEIKSGGKLAEKTYKKIALARPISVKDKNLPDTLSARIYRELRELGYFFPKVKIDSLAYARDSSSVFVRIVIDERRQSIVKSVSVQADTPEDSSYVYEKLAWQIGLPFQPAIMRHIFSEILKKYENNGFPFARLKIKSVKWLPANDSVKDAALFIEFRNGRTSVIDSIVVKGNTKTKDYVIIRNARIKKGEVYSRKKIFDAVANLARLGFFKKISFPKFYYNSQNKGVLEFYVEEKNTNVFDGIVGYVPKRNDAPGYLTGYVKMNLSNIFGTERAFGFEWKKIDRYSQYFDIKYKEPWLFGMPLNLNLSVMQRTQDTSYVQRKYGAVFEYLATSKLHASLLYSFEETVPFENAAVVVKHSVFNTSGVNFFYDTRDDVLIPASGYLINTTLKYSRKNVLSETSEEGDDNQYRIEADAAAYVRLYRTNIAALGLHYRNVEGKKLEISDLYRFGGTNSLRGFNEDIFSGNVIAWSNLEYRLLLSRDSYLFAFFDSGYFYNKVLKDNPGAVWENFTYGYGAGISFSTGVGIMKVSFALGEGDAFSQGKIHFGIAGGF
jgi:outer membrane protein insertion porin family